MAKDPAFLFYPGDWQGGTATMTRHLKGCYMDLLIAQFNNGPLSLEEIRTVLGQDQANWTVLSKKFKQDEHGLFYNEKLATEIKKRAEYSQKQKDRIVAHWEKVKNDPSYIPRNNHGTTAVVPLENGNENKDVIKNKVRKGGKGGNLKFPFDSPEFTQAWALLMAGPKWKNKPLTALQASLNKLAKETEADAILMITNCTAGNWQGLVELKPHEKTHSHGGMKGTASAYQNVLNQFQNE